MLLTIYQIKIAATKRPTKITNTNLLFCLSQLCWFVDCSFSFEFQPVPCTVGTAFAFALVVVVDEESETVNDGVVLETAEGIEEDEREEEGSNDDEMLLLLIKSSAVAVAVALLVSVALLVVCANTTVIKHVNNIIKKCFDKLIVQELKKLNTVLYKVQIYI